MSAPTSTIWPIELHTKAKHEILRRYLGAWFPILARWNGRIIYIDGFAGPGEYEGGEPGSPVIALDVAATHRLQLSVEVKFLFIEEDKERKDYLRAILDRRVLPGNFRVEAKCAEFHKVLKDVLNDLESHRLKIAPTFAFIDPFGFTGVPMQLISRLLRHPKTETLINFQVRDVNRFLERPELRAHMTELFGTDEWMLVANSAHRVEELRKLYQKQLNKSAKFVRYFTMRDQTNQPIYDLFFASNNERGHEEMKRAMWKAGPRGDFIFSDATNPDQLVLLTLDYTQPLLDAIYTHFEGEVDVPVKRVNQWVTNETPFLDSHMKAALKKGEQDVSVVANPLKADGKKRKKRTFPDGVLVSFPKR